MRSIRRVRGLSQVFIIFLYCYNKTPYNFFSFLPLCFFFCLLKNIFFNLEIIVDSQELAKKYTGLCALSPVPPVLTSCLTVGQDPGQEMKVGTGQEPVCIPPGMQALRWGMCLGYRKCERGHLIVDVS